MNKQFCNPAVLLCTILFSTVLLGFLVFSRFPFLSSNLQYAPTITVDRVAQTNPTYRVLQLVSPLPTPTGEATPAAIEQLPQLSTTHDLFFVNERRLLRWRHQTHTVETIIDAPLPPATATDNSWRELRYTVSDDQQKLLISYAHGIVGKASQRRLLLYAPKQSVLTTLLNSEYDITEFAIAPDQQWAAYILRDVKPQQRHSWWQNWLGWHQCTCGESPYRGTIYAMRLQPPYQPQKVQNCGMGTGECKGLLGWLFNNQQLLWHDGAGYWTADLVQNRIHLILRNSQPALAIDPLRDKLYRNRYLISWLYYQPELSYGILDSQSWRVLALPHETGQKIHGTPLLWLADNQLLWAKPAVGDATQKPTLELWTLRPGQSEFLIQQQVLQIPTNANLYPASAIQLADGRLLLALVNADYRNGGQSGLYELNLTTGVLYKRNDFPTLPAADLAAEPGYFGELFWAPDGTGAIYARHIPRSPNWRTFYIPMSGAPTHNLTTLLGDAPEQLTWLRTD